MNIYVMQKLVLFFVLFASCVASAGKLTPALEKFINASSQNSTENISVIISFNDSFNVTEFNTKNNSLSQREYRQSLILALKENFAKSYATISNSLQLNVDYSDLKNLWLSNKISVSVPIFMIKKISNRSSVKSIDIDYVLKLENTVVSVPVTDTEINLKQLKIPIMWRLGYYGQGVVIANMDTGVDLSHSELSFRWRGGVNSWFDPYLNSTIPYDGDNLGHGTRTMGVMVAGDGSGTNIGVAPGAQWIAAKIFDDNGEALISNIHLAFQWFLDPDNNPSTNDSPDIVNASWGLLNSKGNCNTEFELDINLLKQAGISVVFSAGNFGSLSNSSLSPANNSSAFSVGSVNSNIDVSWFSSRGPNACNSTSFPNVVAPGESIKSTDRVFFGGVDSYSFDSGTSFAAPHISGLMALLLSANKFLTVSDLENLLEQSAIDIYPPGVDNDSGYGLANVMLAYQLLGYDYDNDQILDKNDNCILAANTNQLDSDNDGYGNLCDADLDNDGLTTVGDYFIFLQSYGLMVSQAADFDGDSEITVADYFIFLRLFGTAPGPSNIDI